MSQAPLDLIILGGGPAGLAMAFWAQQKNLRFIIIEKAATLGGNAQTFSYHDHLYDSGAHRWHNAHPAITQEIIQLLKDDFSEVSIPSVIHYEGREVIFPLTPGDLLRKMPWATLWSMGRSFLRRKSHPFQEASFAASTQEKYGREVAETFIWRYTEKLWGAAPALLSQEISGKRLDGLALKTLMFAHKEHLDGNFYYPTQGIGQIFQAIIAKLPTNVIRTQQDITHLVVKQGRIQSIHLGETVIDASSSQVVSTLAPDTMARLLGLQPPQMHFRNVQLLFVEIKRAHVSKYASHYFPEVSIPFTRVVEPKNRSQTMSPSDRTSLIVEWPCSPGDEASRLSHNEILARVWPILKREFKLTDADLGVSRSHLLPNAYPLLTLESIAKRQSYLREMAQFTNVQLLGRNAQFAYLHLHDLFASAKHVASEIKRA
jgi:protoporphyrinogen oxidase